MKVLTSFIVLNTGEGERISFTYSEVAEDGTIISQNNKKNFLVLLGIHLLDHIIIGDHRYVSFREKGIFDEYT